MADKLPSICRMVVFIHRRTKDGAMPHLKSPAVVQRVYPDGKVDLKIDQIGAGAPTYRSKVEQGFGEYQWEWPEKFKACIDCGFTIGPEDTECECGRRLK